MNPLLKTVLREIANDGLTVCYPDDLDDIIELNRLADRFTESEPSPDYVALMEPAVMLGDVRLWRPSLGVADFIAFQLPDLVGNEDDHLRGMLYALAHGRDPEKLWRRDASTFVRDVRRWCRSIKATLPEINAALARFKQAEEAPIEAPVMRGDNGWLIERLMTEYGGTAEQWIWGTPLDAIKVLSRNLATRKAAESKQSGAPDPDLPGIKALGAFRAAETAFRGKLKARSNG